MEAVLRAEFQTFYRHPSLDSLRLEQDALLLRWQGQNPQAPALLLASSLDVREPDTADLTKWTYHPFSGKIEGGYIWGLGSLQNKAASLALSEALDSLAREGFVPQRPIYLLLAHSAYTQTDQALPRLPQNIGLALYPDLGLVQDWLPESNRQAALVGIASRLEIPLSEAQIQTFGAALETGQTQSIAEPTQATLAKELWNSLQWPLQDSTAALHHFLAYWLPEQSPWLRYRFLNNWLFGGQNKALFQENALLRNLLLPYFDGRKLVLQHQEQSRQLQLPIYLRRRGSLSFSPPNGFGWEALHSTIASLYPDALVLPTGQQHPQQWQNLRQQIPSTYGFAPFQYDKADWLRFEKGLDERLSIQAYERMIQFYYVLIKQLCK